MAIRIIDILNMFKTGNKIPTKIKVKHGAVYDYYKWSVKDQWYVTYDDTTLLIIACPKDLLEEVEIIEEDKYDYTIRQISKMIASGDLKEIYSKYLSECPIGFMQEQQVYDYLTKKDKSKEDNNRITKDFHPYGSYPDEILYNDIVMKLCKVIDKINNMEK